MIIRIYQTTGTKEVHTVELTTTDCKVLNETGELNESCAVIEVDAINAERLGKLLAKTAFECMHGNGNELVARIKAKLVSIAWSDDVVSKKKLPAQFGEDKTFIQSYHTLSHYFSDKEGITIEKFHIRQMVERVKHYLQTTELTIKEIHYMMHYSSVSALNRQFSSVVGKGPAEFKKCFKMKKE